MPLVPSDSVFGPQVVVMQKRRLPATLLSLLLEVSLFVVCAEGGCSCSSTACLCSGDDITDLSGILSPSICSNDGPVSTLIIQDAPNLVSLPEGFKPLRNSPCDGLAGLETLELHRTGIQNLSNSVFQGLPNLRKLDISNNSLLRSYRDGVFSQLGGSLQELIATDNRVHSLTKGVFAGLRHLQVLTLSRNKIGYIEESVFAFSGCCEALMELSLDDNILTDLEDSTFVGLTNLEVLNLRGNPLQRLSPGLFRPFSRSLKRLYMSHDDFAPFGGFDTIPSGLFAQMSGLKVLSMIELKITNLTKNSFAGLSNLRILSLRGNRLTALPRGCFSTMPQLEELDLSANGMVCIPDDSGEEYPNLRRLDLSLNGLTHITKRSFSMLSSSKSTPDYPRILVNISSNPIRRIETDAFCGFKAPVELILAPEGSPIPAWASMDNWPDNPFALVGSESIIRGLKASESVEGRPDAKALCAPEGHLFRNKMLSSSLYKNSKYTEKDIETSLNSECPWLLPDELSPWQLSKLGVPGLSRVHARDGSSAIEEGSRIYLLIIVAVCITFLLAALTVIMCYRAWSRRATQKLATDAEANGGNGNGATGAPRSAISLSAIGEVSEKQELLDHQPNGKAVEVKTAEGKGASPVERAARLGRRNSEPKAEELGTMTAFGVL